jgi:DNA-binding cell septation regulator SpoVG
VPRPVAPSAATAAGFGGRPHPRQAKIRKFTAWQNEARTVAGFLSIELPSGLIVNDCKLMVGPQGRRWIALPAIKQLDAEGQPRLGADGKTIWTPIIEFTSRDVRDKFNEVVLAALRRSHPEAFEEGAR